MVEIPKPNLITVGSWKQLGKWSRHAYRKGYLDTAELLADAIENSEGFNVQLLSIIYPMLNLYRHFIELSLKDFIDPAIFVGPYVEDLYHYCPVNS